VATRTNIVGHALRVAAILPCFASVSGTFASIFAGILGHGWSGFRLSAWVRNGPQS